MPRLRHAERVDPAAWPERAFAFALAEPTSTFALSPSDDPAHADFLIGGRLLRDYIRPAPDAFPMFAWRHAVIVAPLRSKLRLESASDVPSGRVQIYACSHCYDPACGSISANVVRVGDRIVWSNIAQELLDVSERSDWVLRGLPGPAGFAFDAEHYLRALAGP